ncbi:hypothetical protein NE237_016438 [Protea cynaroides]|uniref:Uncharacterized protein n=1 Tax=Protea cynaroides TaxID=273540 RepID=A0A9Q0HET1_9MAGN|nr:hypothetical protein NE237_016438 [Protea cynaroides]
MSGDEDEGLFEDNAKKSRKRKDYSKLGKGMLTSCVENLGLVDGGFAGRKLTWCNNQEGARSIWARLDRVLLNKEWSLNNLKVQHLARLSSDHAPLLINFEASQFRNVRNAEDDVLAREHDLEVNNCDENLRKLRDPKVMYQQTLLQEETFRRQNSRVKWGDCIGSREVFSIHALKIPMNLGLRWVPQWSSSPVKDSAVGVSGFVKSPFHRMIWEIFAVSLWDKASILGEDKICPSSPSRLWPFTMDFRDWASRYIVPLFCYFYFPSVDYPG